MSLRSWCNRNCGRDPVSRCQHQLATAVRSDQGDLRFYDRYSVRVELPTRWTPVWSADSGMNPIAPRDRSQCAGRRPTNRPARTEPSILALGNLQRTTLHPRGIWSRFQRSLLACYEVWLDGHGQLTRVCPRALSLFLAIPPSLRQETASAVKRSARWSRPPYPQRMRCPSPAHFPTCTWPHSRNHGCCPC